MNHIDENICIAIDTIVQARLQLLNFDITKRYTIVSDKNALHDFYTVTDQSITFEAKANGHKYNIGDIVYVLIPEGRFELTKVIIGKI